MITSILLSAMIAGSTMVSGASMEYIECELEPLEAHGFEPIEQRINEYVCVAVNQDTWFELVWDDGEELRQGDMKMLRYWNGHYTGMVEY